MRGRPMHINYKLTALLLVLAIASFILGPFIIKEPTNASQTHTEVSPPKKHLSFINLVLEVDLPRKPIVSNSSVSLKTLDPRGAQHFYICIIKLNISIHFKRDEILKPAIIHLEISFFYPFLPKAS